VGKEEGGAHHEIIAGCSIPIPNLNQDTPILILGLQVAVSEEKIDLNRRDEIKFHFRGLSTTYKVNVSFQTGFNVALIVFDFRLTPSESGISFIFTYGSLRPLGSIGMRFRLRWDKRKQMEKVLIKSMKRSFLPVSKRRCVLLGRS
jgi:hypothetical protein